jgi:hypothetical protein
MNCNDMGDLISFLGWMRSTYTPSTYRRTFCTEESMYQQCRQDLMAQVEQTLSMMLSAGTRYDDRIPL